MAAKKPAKAKKPEPRTIYTDDCTVTVGGVEYHPHEGEWVNAMGGKTAQLLQVMRAFGGLKAQLDAIEGEDDETARGLALADDSHGEAIKLLQAHITGWNWTDMRGQPLPQPADDPGVFLRLELEELYYLILAVRGETPGEQKNGLRPSPTSSSVTAPPLNPG